MTSFAIGPQCLSAIRGRVPDGGTVLELGSGKGTAWLAQHYRVYSVEHDLDWVGRYDSTYIHAPIVDGWYDAAVLERELPTEYDLLLIDGPTGSIGRLGMLDHLGLFDLSVPIVVDDVNRTPEMALFRALFGITARLGVVLDESDGRQVGVIW